MTDVLMRAGQVSDIPTIRPLRTSGNLDSSECHPTMIDQSRSSPDMEAEDSSASGAG
jgi:hypothetical protein